MQLSFQKPVGFQLRSMTHDRETPMDQDYRNFVEQLTETRRHFDVVGEALRGEIQLVAEGEMNLEKDLGGIRQELTVELSQLKTMLRLSHADLMNRISCLERTVEALVRESNP